MSEEMLSIDRRVEKHFTPLGFDSLPSSFIFICTTDCAILPNFAMQQTTSYWQQALLRNESNREHKTTNVGRIALERQARQFNSWSFSLDQFSFIGAKNLTLQGFEPLTSRSKATYTNHCATSHLIQLCCNRFYISNFEVLDITQNWWTKAWKSH